MLNVDHDKHCEVDEYGNLIDGTTVPPVTLCNTVRCCYECPTYDKCQEGKR